MTNGRNSTCCSRIVASVVMVVLLVLPLVSLAKTYAYVLDITAVDKEKKYLVEHICIDGYVYINMYQKKPVMTIDYGNSTALTNFPVLQSTTQSFITIDGKSLPQKCKKVPSEN